MFVPMIFQKEFHVRHDDAPIVMEIPGHKEFELIKALFDELLSDIFDCDIRLGSDPDTRTRIGLVIAYHRGCNNRRFARSGGAVDHDDSIVILVG